MARPNLKPTTGRDFARAVFDAAARRRVLTIGTRTTRALGLVSPLVREGAEILYQFERPFILDSNEYVRSFGGGPTPYHRGTPVHRGLVPRGLHLRGTRSMTDLVVSGRCSVRCWQVVELAYTLYVPH